MNKDIADAWVTRLRDPNNRQVKGALARVKDGQIIGHCCLGILCEIAVERDVIERRVENDRYVVFGKADDEDTGILPENVRTWAGVRSNTGIVRLETGTTTLAFLNDSDYAFSDIADIIEENWGQL